MKKRTNEAKENKGKKSTEDKKTHIYIKHPSSVIPVNGGFQGAINHMREKKRGNIRTGES